MTKQETKKPFGTNLFIAIVLLIIAAIIFDNPAQEAVSIKSIEIDEPFEISNISKDGQLELEQLNYDKSHSNEMIEIVKKEKELTIDKVKQIKSKIVRENHPNASSWVDYQEWDSHVFEVIKDCQTRGLIKDQCAYILATMQHETASFTTYKEISGEQNAITFGYSGGPKYFGRGYIQLTHDYNYAEWSNILGIDILSNPDLVTQDHSIMRRVLIEFMLTRGLTDYINENQVDFVHARQTVNAMDKAHLLARYATAWAVELEGLY